MLRPSEPARTTVNTMVPSLADGAERFGRTDRAADGVAASGSAESFTKVGG